jgi:SM-20-related protein
MLDYLRVNAFDTAACEEILAELRSLGGAAATVYGKKPTATIDQAMRKATRLMASAETRDRVLRRLFEQKGSLESHFGLHLGEPEEPQFLRYVTGDYFVAHQDGNTPLTLDDSRFRRISIIIFLNSQSEEAQTGTYGGGALLLHGRYPEIGSREHVPGIAGTMVAFRSETTHEVTPLVHGERYTVVSWYPTSPAF